MSQHWVDDAKYSLPSTYPTDLDYQPSRVISLRLRNICQLLASREISPRTKNSSKRFWHQSSTLRTAQLGRRKEIIDARRALISWVESNSLRNLLAKYCPLLPPPRSTIAAAFSLDGKRLASTHGDHTVKIIDCQTGRCLKVLSGHRRTPWVVRFHPLQSEILASGSLDHEVRLWDAHTAVCIGSYDFYRPIASIAFHAQGEILAVASGHKLFLWHYNNNKRGDSSPPLSVLKTERSLRAVHFHPYALPLLLTAEVSDLDSPDYPLTLATTSGYPQCAPAVFVSNADSNTHTDVEDTIPLMSSPYLYWQTFFRDSGRPLQQYSMATGLASWQRTELSQQTNSNMGRQHNVLVTPMEVFPSEASISNLVTETAVENSLLVGMELGTENMENEVDNRASSVYQGTSLATRVPSMLSGQNVDISTAGNSSNNDDGRYNQLIPFSGLPFLHGWIMGQQTHAGLHTMLPVSAMQRSIDHGSGANFMSSDLQHNGQAALVITSGHLRGDVQNSSRHHSRSRIMVSADSGEAPAELPCTVKLRIWSHDIQVPCATLVPERCLLTIPHAVLCSEMGAHFSPCGRFLAACVACILPQFEGDHGLQSQIIADASGVVTSPTRHPISAHQVIYELHIYSLEKATFGSVLASTAIRAAHCLTSIQFSPTSEHILLAYGRRHGSLRRNLVIDALHTYTIMEVYRVSDMELVSVLPSADDEVNVACFHPLAGGGLVYGTKEGKLRIFQYDGPRGADCMGPNSLFEDNSLEGLQYALEG